MRYLWITSIAMTAGGAAFAAGGLLGLLEPIAVVFGLLLLWSGIVKLIVLRIWQKSLRAPAAPSAPPAESARPLLGRFRV